MDDRFAGRDQVAKVRDELNGRSMNDRLIRSLHRRGVWSTRGPIGAMLTSPLTVDRSHDRFENHESDFACRIAIGTLGAIADEVVQHLQTIIGQNRFRMKLNSEHRPRVGAAAP